MVANVDNIYIFTAPALLAFSHLFTPSVWDEKENKFRDARADEDGWYDATFLLDATSPDLAAIKTIAGGIVEAAQFKDKNGNLIPREQLQVPWETGEAYLRRRAAKPGAKDDYDGALFEGKTLLKANTKYPPLLNLHQNGVLSQFRDQTRHMAEQYFYSGVMVLAELNVVKHQVGSNVPGVKCYLGEMVSTNVGDRIAGGKPTAEKFGAHIGAAKAESPSAGMPGASTW